MTWVIKILNRDFKKVNKEWDGNSWGSVNLGLSDFMINDFQFSESTWREVSYSKQESEVLINREDLTDNKLLTALSPRYQFLNPLVEKVDVVLPPTPKYNVKYIIKNNSKANNKLQIRETLGGPVIFTLDSLDEYATLFHDKIEWQISI
jgi:hypothetical protein